MQYFISFLEGIITFISPCLLPMLPIYLSYFAGGAAEEGRRERSLQNALGFVLGFTLVFVSLGAFAGSIGRLLVRYTAAVNLVSGAVVVLFGLNYLGVLKLGFFSGGNRKKMSGQQLGFGAAVLFGIIFSIGWTPCVGAFLGSALLLASQQGSVGQGILMLLAYSLGLGIPFVASALLIDRLKIAFVWIKQHYRIINLVSGGLLVIIGVLMMTGWMRQILYGLSGV